MKFDHKNNALLGLKSFDFFIGQQYFPYAIVYKIYLFRNITN